MEEIRCPMCGKPNPDHLETCQHCQARLKPLIISSDESLPAEPDNNDAGLPDWLRSDQQDEAPSEAESEAESTPEDDPADDDWMNKLREEGDSAPIDNSALDESPVYEDSEEGDWLDRIKELRDTDEEPPEEDDSSSLFDGALPSWMSEGGEEPALEESPAEEDSSIFDGALPSWMSEKEEEPTTDEVIPQDEAPSPEPGASIPDWLAASEEQAAELDKEVEVDESELPEWLAGSDQAEPEPTPEETPILFPDLQEAAAPASEELASAEPSDDELPDWFSTKAESSDDSPPSSEPADDELPDWMTEPSGVEAEPATSIPESTPDPDIELPAWMLESAEDVDAQPAAESTEGEIPDWMSGEEAEPQVSTIPAEPDPETPDWLEKIGDDAIPELASDDLSPTGEDIFKIDQLTELLRDEDDLQIPEPEGAIDDGVAPAELPGWLEAMRPVESSADGDSTAEQGQTEQTGPLAGLSGVLMAEPEIARLKQAPKLSSRLQVSETQQEHVRVFRELLETEGQAEKQAKPIVVSSQGLLRWLSAFFLIFVIGLVIIGETQFVPAPPQASVPVEVLNTSSLINSLAPKDPVLVSFDFEPGTSGEMNAAAAAVVDHLMIRGAYLTLISTSPTGPALAEYFISTVQREHQYTSGSQYVNLGYIPGGASGLLGFVQMPQRIKPLSFDGFDPWITAPLDGIYALSDFKMVLVITDNPDIAQSWIEQVEPRIQDTPLITVVSAQVEPILRPFVGGEGAQVRGMVSGVIGGTAYEQVTGKDNLGRTYWDALNFSLMTAIAAILIGGIVNVFSILLRSRNRGEA